MQVSGNIMLWRPPRHNFVVSAITFEGFKLPSSNLTHALLIQISSIIDIVVPSKMAAGGHFVKKKKKLRSVWIWNGQKCHQKWISDIQNGRQIRNGQNCYQRWISDIQNGRSIWNGQKCNKKLFTNIQYVRRRPFCKKKSKKINSILIWNGQKCDRKLFSDIRNGRWQPLCQKFPKKIKLPIDLKWPEIQSKVNFGHPKWPMAAIMSKI